MTDIDIYVKKHRYRMTVDGHTDPKVCAGISAIACMLYGVLVNHGVTWNEEVIEDGHVILDVSSDDERVKEDFYMAYIGLKQIEAGYPDTMSIQYVNEAD